MWPTIPHQAVQFPFSREIGDQSPVAWQSGGLDIRDYAVQIRHFSETRSQMRITTRDRDQSRVKGNDLTT